VGVRFGAGTADDNFYSVTGGIDEAAVAGRECDGEKVGITRFAEGQGIAFRVGGEAAPEVAVQGFFLREVDSRGLPVKSDSADTAFLPQDGATDLVIAVGARRGGGLGETKGELDPFVFHEWALFFRYVQAVENPVKDGGEDDSEECDEDDSREEGVRGGEYLGGYGRQALAVDGALSAHEHGGFDKGIFPGQSSEVVIPENSDSEGDADQADGHGQVKQDAAKEDGVRGQRFAVVLEGQEGGGH